MICFLDMTFCTAPCAYDDCHRKFTEADRLAVRKWWGSDNAPIAWADMSEGCPDYRAKDNP